MPMGPNYISAHNLTATTDHQRLEASLLRAALPMVKRAMDEETEKADSNRAKYQRLLDLDLGPDRIFASIAESCVDIKVS